MASGEGAGEAWDEAEVEGELDLFASGLCGAVEGAARLGFSTVQAGGWATAAVGSKRTHP